MSLTFYKILLSNIVYLWSLFISDSKNKKPAGVCIDKNSCFVILRALDAPFENAAACGLMYDREQFIGIPPSLRGR